MKGEIKAIFFTLFGILGNVLGGWSESLKTLVILMVLDYLTGTIVAICFKTSKKTKHGGVSSNASFKGMVKKTVMLSIILVAHRIDLMFNTTVTRDFAIFGLIGTELISLKENWDCMGIKVPNVIKKTISKLAKIEEEVEKEND